MPELTKSNRPEAVVTIVNRKGLHARASAKFVKLAETFDAEVTVTRDGQSVGGTSIMGLMMLAAGPGSTLHIAAEGKDGPEALEALVTLVETVSAKSWRKRTRPRLPAQFLLQPSWPVSDRPSSTPFARRLQRA